MADRLIIVPTIWHRRAVTAADGSIDLSGARLAELIRGTTDKPNGAFATKGTPRVELRLWGAADGGTVVVSVVGWPPNADRADNVDPEDNQAIARVCPKGAILYQATFTCGTSSTTINPITGQTPTAATSWFEADTIGAAAITGTTNPVQIDAAGANRSARLLLDTLGYPYLFAYLTTLGANIARVDVALRHIG